MADVEQLTAILHDLVHEAVPEADPVAKYGGMLFTLRPELKEGQFCGVFPYAEHVQLSFAQGAELSDPDGVLSGSGKQRRHINFTSLDQIDRKQVIRLLIESAERHASR